MIVFVITGLLCETIWNRIDMESNISKFVEICRQDGQAVERFIVSYYNTRPTATSFLDGGCNIGYHTFGAAKHFQGTIIAVDANRVIYEQFLKKLSEQSQDFQQRIVPVFGALQSDNTLNKISFFCSSSHPGRSSLNTKPWGQWGKGEVIYENASEVPAHTIDQLCKKFVLKDIGFIKLDLEGGEFQALMGAQNVLQNQRPHIAMEYGIKLNNQEMMGYSQYELFEFFANQKYSLLSPWGEKLDINKSYQFWYAFAIPIEDLNDSISELQFLFSLFCKQNLS